MRNDIELYINDQPIEFSADPKILLNYNETDFHNPTIIKNSFTKQIEVQGTSANNRVFNDIWKLDRIQYTNLFNPIKKASFKLFVGGDLQEKGYCKLNSVTSANNTLKYSITLYGGLGDFLYSLMYDGDNKKNLASLSYSTSDRVAPSLDFNINKDTVNAAWGQLTGTGSDVVDDKWNVINFIPAYNGLPDDFDSDKVLINNYNLDHYIFQNTVTSGGKTYRGMLDNQPNNNGYTLGELSEEMTEWETYDLRSYLQRPVISMRRIIQACCQPENNGGYQVKLDEHFFNSENPYYWDSWLTLPMLKSLERDSNESIDVTGTTVARNNSGIWSLTYPSIPLGKLNNVNMRVNVSFTPDSSSSAQNLYSARHYTSRTTPTLQSFTFVKKFDYSAGVIIQLLGYDSSNNVVGKSKVYQLSTEKNLPNSQNPLYTGFGDDKENYEFIQGSWIKSGNTYSFVNADGQNVDLVFTFSNNVQFSRLAFKVYVNSGSDVRYAFQGQPYYTNTNKDGSMTLYSSINYNTTGNSRDSDVFALDRVIGKINVAISDFQAIETVYESMFTNTLITKADLLGAGSDSSSKSPADYLISYLKLFGLYLYFDSTEESDDESKYPSGVIHIMDRDTFYTDEIVDLSNLIDYSKNLVITPATANAKWYRFDLEQAESQAQIDYNTEYNTNYGSQLISTNYEFDNNTTDLYDGNAFKGGIMVREKDKYYKQPVSGIPPYVFNGMTYQLFSMNGTDLETYEIEQEITPTNSWRNINTLGLDNYDCFPKLQLHQKENSGVDGEDILVFLKGTVSTDGEAGKTNYYLTDDVNEMVYLNDATACWILTNSEYNANGNRIAYKINYLPFFTRDIILAGQEGNIVHSWNFGHPQSTFVPNTFTTEGDSIYDKCWKNYINDLYDVNTRLLSCYSIINFDGKPWPYWLRRFYWFENSIWRLNSIKDLNLSDFAPTQLEFVKVQDIENYKLDRIRYSGTAYIVFNENEIGYQGGTVSGNIHLQGGGYWTFSDGITSVDEEGNSHSYSSEDFVSPFNGSGVNSPITVTVPANTGNTDLTWYVSFIYDDVYYYGSFKQLTNNTPYMTITPSAQTVSWNTTTVYFDYIAKHIFNLSTYFSVPWGTIELIEGKVKLTLEQNTEDNARTGVIQLTGDDSEDNQIIVTATITQNSSSIEVSTDNLVLDYNTNPKTFTITSNSEWTITSVDN